MTLTYSLCFRCTTLTLTQLMLKGGISTQQSDEINSIYSRRSEKKVSSEARFCDYTFFSRMEVNCNDRHSLFYTSQSCMPPHVQQLRSNHQLLSSTSKSINTLFEVFQNEKMFGLVMSIFQSLHKGEGGGGVYEIFNHLKNASI